MIFVSFCGHSKEPNRRFAKYANQGRLDAVELHLKVDEEVL